MSKRVMCVWLPNWPAQRASVATSRASSDDHCTTEPTVATPAIEPIVLYRHDSRRGNVVAAANQSARQAGILPQMPLSQCGPLCPTARIRDYEPQRDLEALIELAEQSQAYSPIVGLEPLADRPWAGRALLEPQCLVLDVTGVAPHFGGEQALANSVAQWLVQQGYLSCIAIGSSLGQAWALANYAYRQQVSDGILAWEKSGCVARKSEPQSGTQPPSWISLEEGSLQTSHLLRTLPIEALRLDLLTSSKLHRLGIRRIAQLLALPRSGLPSRFGKELLTHLDYLDPNSTEVIRSLHPSAEMCSTHALEYATPHRDEVGEVIETQLRALASELQQQQIGALRVTTRIAMEKSAIDSENDSMPSAGSANPLASVLQVSFYQPTDDPEHMRWLLDAQLESPACRVGDAYRAKEITTQVTLSSPIVWKQNDLFGSDHLKHRDSIAKLIDHLSVRMGRENVATPSIHADPAPENSYRWQPMTGIRKDGTEQDTRRKLKRAPKRDYQEPLQGIGPSPQSVWRRPMRLLGNPMPLAITEMTSNQLPAIVRYPRANTSVCDAQGPERIQTGWWAGATLQRDYYRMRLQNGTWLWCFLDLKSRQWFIHGIFD